MLTTAELRWFERGTVPQEVKQWFQHDLGQQIEPPEEREDLYLYSPGCDYLGIKLRQGRLEIKWRRAELGTRQFEGVEGKAEKWSKWLCEDPTAQCFQPSDVVGRQWVGVEKVRLQRQYQVEAYEPLLTSVSVTESIDEGCTVELTQLSVKGSAWWSLAFEAFAKDDDLVNHLQAVASWIFKTYPGPKLQVQNSYAYPIWLSLCHSASPKVLNPEISGISFSPPEVH